MKSVVHFIILIVAFLFLIVGFFITTYARRSPGEEVCDIVNCSDVDRLRYAEQQTAEAVQGGALMVTGTLLLCVLFIWVEIAGIREENANLKRELQVFFERLLASRRKPPQE